MATYPLLRGTAQAGDWTSKNGDYTISYQWNPLILDLDGLGAPKLAKLDVYLWYSYNLGRPSYVCRLSNTIVTPVYEYHTIIFHCEMGVLFTNLAIVNQGSTSSYVWPMGIWKWIDVAKQWYNSINLHFCWLNHHFPISFVFSHINDLWVTK